MWICSPLQQQGSGLFADGLTDACDYRWLHVCVSRLLRAPLCCWDNKEKGELEGYCACSSQQLTANKVL
jgi:hypothetical protein